MAASWFRSWFPRPKQNPTHQGRRRRKPPRKLALQLEVLEDRFLPAVYLVQTLADNSDPVITAGHAGTEADPFLAPSLRSAILAANATTAVDDTIVFDSGLTGTITLSGTQLTISDDVTITGPGAADLAVSGNNASRVFNVDDGTSATISVVIESLTLTGGSVGGYGNHGGGIRNVENLTLRYSTLSGNSAEYGGGGLANDSGTMTVQGSTISGNSARFGGGLFNSLGTVMVLNTTLSGNSISDIGGGGLFNYQGTVAVQNSTISGNSARFGGGLVNSLGTVTVQNSTISGNSAAFHGGGLSNLQGNVTVQNSTLTGNVAGNGGGLYNSDGTVTLANSLVAGNTASTGSEVQHNNLGEVNANAFNLFGHSGSSSSQAFSGFSPGANDVSATSGSTAAAALGDILDPLLRDNGGPTKTHALVAGSPAINAGAPAFDPGAAGLPNDQRRAPFARVFGGRVDIGAFERQTVTFAFPLEVDTLEDENDGDYSDGDRSLREMIGLANGSIGADTITFANGLTGTITLTLGQLTISDDVTITGPGATQLAVSGNNASRVFNIDDGTTATIIVVIEGLTVAGGNAGDNIGDNGGGVRNAENLTLRDSVLSGNSARLGGGLYNRGTVSLQNSTLSGNSARFGGGLYSGFSDSLFVQDSTLSGNSAVYSGGALFSGGYGTVSVQNSVLSGNTAGDSGGALYSGGSGSVSVQNSTLSGNSAGGSGGGLFSGASGSVSLQNSTLSGNSAGGRGGGLYSGHSGSVSVQNSTVSGNSAGGSGGGLFSGNTGSLRLANSIVANSNNGDVFTYAPVNAQGVNIVEDGSVTGAGVLIGDPLLGPLQDNGGPTFTHAPLPGSPALDAGEPGFTPPPDFDQRGAPFARVFGGRIDIGAFEVQTLALVVDTLTDEDDDDFSPGDRSLREALRHANANPGADTITFVLPADSTITLAGTQLDITDDVTVTGPGAAQLAVSGNNASRVFTIADGTSATITVLIDGLTITGGNDGNGGGILNTENLTLRNSTLSGNTASNNGGGVLNNGGALLLQNSTLSGNSSQAYGGGIRNQNGGSVVVQNSTLSGNRSQDYGGGISNHNATVTVQNSTLSGNSAAIGGGFYIESGSVTVRNSTLSGNSAGVGGGGLYNRQGMVTLRNSIVANSVSGDLFNSSGAFDIAFSLIEDGSLITPGVDGNLSGDANLGPLQDNGGLTFTHALLPGSPALNAGDPAFAPPPDFDQRDVPFVRVVGGRIDIGAFEAGISIILEPLANERNFFVDSAGLSENLFGGNEKWLRGDVHQFSNSWYFITTTGDLFEWDGNNGLGGNRLVNVGANGWENPELIVNAAALFAANPAELQVADLTRSFYRSSADNFSFNLLGGAEKWIKGLIAAKSPANQGNPWYFILPSGAVFEWSGSGLNGTQVAAITPDVNVYKDPSLLYNAFQDLTVNSAGFDEIRHFFFDSSDDLVHNLNENLLGGDEKRFRGDTNTFGNPWYFVLPNGDLVEWDGTAAATGNVLANLGANAWDNLERVVEDFHAPFTPAERQQLIDLDREHSLFRASNDVDFFFNTLGDQEKRLRGTTNAFGNPWYLLLPNGNLLEWNGGPAAAGNVLATLPVAVYANPLELADAYADGSVLNNVVPLEPFAPNLGGPGDTLAATPLTLVVDTLDDEDDGDFSPGDRSLREALRLTNAHPGADTITFANSLTGGAITLSLGQLNIIDDVTITGLGAANLAISGNNQSRVFNVDDGATATITVVIEDLTLTGGSVGGDGGGIFNNENLTLRDSTLSGNSAASRGGGLYNNGGTLTVQNSTLSGNTATGGSGLGGGAISSSGGSLTLQNSTLSGNQTTAAKSSGGAVHVTGGSATIQNSTFTNNASYYGGALANTTSAIHVTVTGSTFSGNSVNGLLALGGAIFNARPMTVQNSTLSGNTANTMNGGGAIASTGPLTLLNSTIANNTASGAQAVGGGLYVRGGTASVANTIIAGNTVAGNTATTAGPDIRNTIASLGFNLIGNTSGASGFVASDLQNVPSGLDPDGLKDNGGPTQTIALLADSNAIDAGDPAFDPNAFTPPLDFDQRGAPFARVVGGRVDIGAIEHVEPFDTKGNVRALRRGGQLILIGDALDNGVRVTPGATPGAFIVTGLGDTTINGGPSVEIPGITSSVSISLGNGADVLILGGDAPMVLPRHLTVALGHGDNTLQMQNTKVTGTAIIRGGSHADDFRITGSDFGNVGLHLGGGTNALFLQDVNIAMRTTINGGHGVDVFELRDCVFGGSFGLSTFGGADQVKTNSSQFNGQAIFSLGGGPDLFEFTDAVVVGRFKLSMSHGDDRASIFDSVFQNLALLDGGLGTDTLDAGPANNNQFLGPRIVKSFS